MIRPNHVRFLLKSPTLTILVFEAQGIGFLLPPPLPPLGIFLQAPCTFQLALLPLLVYLCGGRALKKNRVNRDKTWDTSTL